MTGRDGKIARGDAALKAIYEALRETQTPKGRVSRRAGGFSRPGAGIRGCREAAHRLARSGWCASWRSARLPPAIVHRGANAADRARDSFSFLFRATSDGRRCELGSKRLRTMAE